MGFDSSIEWTQDTWNPWHGCKKVSEGCKFCYMYRDKERYGHDPTTVLRSKTSFNDPLKKEEGRLIFTCSWSDWFIEDADEWRPEAWEIIRKTPQHTYQILTKRPERILECLPEDWGDGYENVWLGVSVESGKQMHRVKILKDIPAKVKFISAEPLIAPLIDLYMPFDERLDFHHYDNFIDWVIIGGESGNETGKYRYRECELKWIRDILDWCRHNEIPAFVKQLGTHLATQLSCRDRHGKMLRDFPEDIRVRQFPEAYKL